MMEKLLKSNFKKVIIWGYPLYTHTHSFIHYGWYKAFKNLGYDTYWFSNNNYPVDFDYNNCLFITEGYADNNIPLLKSSIYFVHICNNPSKYLEKECRVIDLRFNLKKTKDYSYDYTRPDNNLINLDSYTYYEEKANDLALAEKYRKNISGYEAIYMLWATDLLPDEINYQNAYLERERTIYHIGTVWSANRNEIAIFKNTAEEQKINFEIRDPWKIKTTNEEAISLIQKSYIAPDIRGSGPTCDGALVEECNHLSIGYIPCRIFKNISYGQLGITNSKAVYDMLGDNVIYSANIYDIFEKAEPYRKDFKRIISSMMYVKNSHTFYNRINSLLKIL